ncbi:MAG: BrnA antitoxin family protein [Bdellovibrionia bacterium]|jgi:uncharacterized protein (DUF4415 family)
MKKSKERNLLKESDFSNPKERITIWMDTGVIDAFRARAKSGGTKYQTLINQALKAFLEKPSLEDRVSRIEDRLKKLA